MQVTLATGTFGAFGGGMGDLVDCGGDVCDSFGFKGGSSGAGGVSGR